MTTLILLGFALGLDSFRVSVGLGALEPPLRRQAAIAAIFGACDGLAPLLGLWLGRAASNWLHGAADLAGPPLLAAYGIFLLATSDLATRTEAESRWQLLGLPVVLSLDNLVGGVGLGLLHYSPEVSSAVLGTMSAVMAFAGLRLGGLVAKRLPFRPARVAGVLLIVASAMALLHAA